MISNAATSVNDAIGRFLDSDEELPAYRVTDERDRYNNPVTRLTTGSAVNRIEGISVSASEYRDGSGAICYVTSASRPGFPSQHFNGATWQEAFRKGAAYRRQFLS
ncbi:hypothetical protein [Marinobacter salsuginis]|jgi:hypothetical protein|uniref:Uncharacterized protein n=1 Tax=Marinobacter salsuginis TaxID=418719 RepID=A0A5M3Q2F2_9GAMM|nr:hypothetical protein [Marinobacter salsuginis]GBO89229.1 hypothetical protein MSSD14B_28970 [Marinobacter salsuginis]